MTRRWLFALAVLSVVLGSRGAFAERLGGSYRGPEEMTKTDKDSSAGSTDSDSGGSTDSGGGKGDSGDNGTGTGAEGGGGGDGGGDGGGGDGGGGAPGAPSGGGGDSGGGPDAGGGSGGTSGKSGGGGPSGGGGGPSAGGAGGTTRGKSSATNDQFYVASWYFEQNRERLFAHYQSTQTSRRLQIPTRSTGMVFGVLPIDMRRRSDITSADKEKIFDVLKRNLQFAKEEVVRDAAVIALGKLGTPAAVELLKAHLNDERDLQVKQDTLIALGLTRSPAAVDALIEAMKNDRGGRITSFALLGLGLSQDGAPDKAAPAVLEYFNANIRKSGNVDQLACAAAALGSLRPIEAVKPLAQALANKNVDDVVRCYAAQALGRFGGLTEAQMEGNKELADAVHAAQKALESAMTKSTQEVERAAAAALGSFPDVKVARILASEGLDKSDPLGAGLAAVSLGRVLHSLDEDDWKNAPANLREIALNPGKSQVKSQYANLALAYFADLDKETKKFFLESFQDFKRDKDVISSMAMASGMRSLEPAQPALIAIAKDPGRDVNTRAYAALAVGMIGQAQASDTAKALRGIYQSAGDNPAVRRGAVFGLGFVGDRDDVNFLVKVIEDTKEDLAVARYTRGAAVIALGMIRDGNSITRIRELVDKQGSDPRTRAYAIAALGYLADKDSVPALSRLFENANFRAKCASIDAVMHQL